MGLQLFLHKKSVYSAYTFLGTGNFISFINKILSIFNKIIIENKTIINLILIGTAKTIKLTVILIKYV